MSAPVPSPFLPESTEPLPLAELTHRFALAGDPGDVAVTGISLGTAAVRLGHLFIALQGVRSHGADYAAEAVERGAVAILTDPAHGDLALGVPVVTIAEPRLLLGDLAAAVYRTREHHPVLLGVTGTNGKTSTSHLLAGLLDLLDVPNGLSSTAERRVGSERRVAGLTTPEATELHALIARMVEVGVEAAAIEVSAQAPVPAPPRRDRLRCRRLHEPQPRPPRRLRRHGGVLRRRSRAVPTGALPSRRRVLDTAWGARVVADAGVPTVTIALAGAEAADWTVTVVEETQAHTAFVLTGSGERRIATRIPVLGAHMAANAALAIVMLLEAGYDFERLRRSSRGRAAWTRRSRAAPSSCSGPGAPAVYRRLRALPARVPGDARRGASRDTGQGHHAVRRRRRPGHDEAAGHGPRGGAGESTSWSSPTTTRGSRIRRASGRRSSAPPGRPPRTTRSTRRGSPRRRSVSRSPSPSLATPSCGPARGTRTTATSVASAPTTPLGGRRGPRSARPGTRPRRPAT